MAARRSAQCLPADNPPGASAKLCQQETRVWLREEKWHLENHLDKYLPPEAELPTDINKVCLLREDLTQD